MAIELAPRLRRRTKRSTAATVGLVAIMVGVALAYFIKSATLSGNSATGGNLIVDTTGLPLDFGSGGARLYPVDNVTTTPPPGSEVRRSFTITNNNTVKVGYYISAACAAGECSWPAGTTPTQAQLDKKNQWEHLYVKISRSGTNIYQGYLKDLTKTADNGQPKQLTTDDSKDLPPASACGATPGCNSATFDVDLWLANDNVIQPQNVTNFWDFTIAAKTPNRAATTTTTLLTAPTVPGS